MKPVRDLTDEELLAEWNAPAPEHFTKQGTARVQELAAEITKRARAGRALLQDERAKWGFK
jgi:hypothetical protein